MIMNIIISLRFSGLVKFYRAIIKMKYQFLVFWGVGKTMKIFIVEVFIKEVSAELKCER